MRYLKRLSAILLALMLIAGSALAQQDIVSTLIGGGPSDMPAVDANLYYPDGVIFDSAGNYYIAAYYQNRVFKVNTSGTLTVFAGLGIPGYAGDGVSGGAAQALLNGPTGVSVDSSGNVYIADYNNYVIRMVDTTNTIHTIAGVAGTCNYGGDGGPGTQAYLCRPNDVAVDSTNKYLFIADQSNCRIRELQLTGSKDISTYAGTGSCSYGGDGGPATSAELNNPIGVAVDGSDNVYISDSYNYRIREVAKKNGDINTIAGNGTYGFSGDTGPATQAEMTYPYILTVNSAGTIVTFPDLNNCRVRQFTVGGNINTVAGNSSCTFGGDTGPATEAELNHPEAVAANSSGAFYVADTNNERVRAFTVNGNINTVAGNGSTTDATIINGVPPTGVTLYNPSYAFEDPSQNIFVSDTGNQEIRELVHSSDVVNTFAGDGTQGWIIGEDGQPATQAELNTAYQVARDSSGNIYIADYNNCQVQMVNSSGTISNFAGALNSGGNPVCGFDGDGGPASNAQLSGPVGLAIDSHNNVYIADYRDQVIREVTTNGTINTIAGQYNRCVYSGDGGPATSAMLCSPTGLAVDVNDNLFIADTGNCRVREISAATGLINTIAGNGACTFSGDGPGTEAALNTPQGVAVDINENVFIADTNNHRIRWLSAGGWLTTFGGDGNNGYNGDGIPALTAEFDYPTGIAQDLSGNFIVADMYNYRIRGISAFAAANFSSDSLIFGMQPVGGTSNPLVVTLSALGPLTLSYFQVSGPFSQANDCPSSMSNGQTCTIDVYFTPTGSGQENGTLTIYDNGYFNPQPSITLTGTGTAIQLSGAPINFPNTLVGKTSGPNTITIKNTGSNSITMGTISLTETTDFSIASNNCPASGKPLNGGASCQVGIDFTPKSTGLKQGTLVINDSDPSSPQLAGMSGTGTSNVVLTPSTLNFPVTPVGILSSVESITLTNNTGGTITLGKPAVSVTTGFVINKKTTCTNGLKIANNGNCVIDLQFKPPVVGYQQGTVSVSDSDPTSPQTALLTGVGTAVYFNPSSINFGSINVGQCSTGTTSTLTNVGTTTLILTSYDIVGPNSPDFSWIGNNCGGFPINVPPAGTCNFTYQFCPTQKKKESANFELYDNANGSPQALPLVGTGQ